MLTQTIQKSRYHTWQYQLERAKQHALNQDFKAARIDIEAVMKARGVLIVSYAWRIHKEFHTANEAHLAAAIFAANDQLRRAVSAYEEYFNPNIRVGNHITALLEKLNENPQADKSPSNFKRYPF